MNTFGNRLRFTTFGESHGSQIGVVIDGLPAGIRFDIDFIQNEMNRRKPGGKYSTKRKEEDKIEVISGVFEGFTTGTSLTMIIKNTNQKSSDYEQIKQIYRPGHADYTYMAKYSIRDYKGGGRSSARETALRVASGAVAKLILNELGIEVTSGLYSMGKIKCKNVDFQNVKNSEVYSLDATKEKEFTSLIKKMQKDFDSVGGSVIIKASKVPVGLGEPIYYKLDSIIANAMMSVNAVKGVEIGNAIEVSTKTGSQSNDQITSKGFQSNNCGGVLGGISSGQDIIVKAYFKPTPSIFKEQKSINEKNEDVICQVKGRHDPCVAIRGSVVCESMLSFVLADMLLLNMTSKIENIHKVYGY